MMIVLDDSAASSEEDRCNESLSLADSNNSFAITYNDNVEEDTGDTSTTSTTNTVF
jgi:hypothetical protein